MACAHHKHLQLPLLFNQTGQNLRLTKSSLTIFTFPPYFRLINATISCRSRSSTK